MIKNVIYVFFCYKYIKYEKVKLINKKIYKIVYKKTKSLV